MSQRGDGVVEEVQRERVGLLGPGGLEEGGAVGETAPPAGLSAARQSQAAAELTPGELILCQHGLALMEELGEHGSFF